MSECESLNVEPFRSSHSMQAAFGPISLTRFRSTLSGRRGGLESLIRVSTHEFEISVQILSLASRTPLDSHLLVGRDVHVPEQRQPLYERPHRWTPRTSPLDASKFEHCWARKRVLANVIRRETRAFDAAQCLAFVLYVRCQMSVGPANFRRKMYIWIF